LHLIDWAETASVGGAIAAAPRYDKGLRVKPQSDSPTSLCTVDWPGGCDAGYEDAADRVRWIKREVPLRRYGTSDEISSMAAFLPSPCAGFVTGAVVPVDGGQTR
jgi:NAD(P)-dependent dehydrogenase (short-subunit alcohol dehydrogenase family)